MLWFILKLIAPPLNAYQFNVALWGFMAFSVYSTY